jgi:hypothetical protein
MSVAGLAIFILYVRPPKDGQAGNATTHHAH